jgi:hypothetical protein
MFLPPGRFSPVSGSAAVPHSSLRTSASGRGRREPDSDRRIFSGLFRWVLLVGGGQVMGLQSGNSVIGNESVSLQNLRRAITHSGTRTAHAHHHVPQNNTRTDNRHIHTHIDTGTTSRHAIVFISIIKLHQHLILAGPSAASELESHWNPRPG